MELPSLVNSLITAVLPKSCPFTNLFLSTVTHSKAFAVNFPLSSNNPSCLKANSVLNFKPSLKSELPLP